MTLDTSPLYAQFQDLLRWCDNTWDKKIQAGQKWFAEKLGCTVRHIKRMFATARREGFLQTLRRWRRTNITTLIPTPQLSLDFSSKNQEVTETGPHNVPTVVGSTSGAVDVFRKSQPTPEALRAVRREIPTPLVIFRDVRSRYAASGWMEKTRKEIEKLCAGDLDDCYATPTGGRWWES